MNKDVQDPLRTLDLESYGFQKGNRVDVPVFTQSNLHERVGAILDLAMHLTSDQQRTRLIHDLRAALKPI